MPQDQYIMTSDWKAVQHIYANSNIFVRQTQNRELLKMMTGPGLAVVHGEDHKRQRRVMQPAFGIPQIKALFPVLSRHAENVIAHVSNPRTTVAYVVLLAYFCDEARHGWRGLASGR